VIAVILLPSTESDDSAAETGITQVINNTATVNTTDNKRFINGLLS